MRHRNPSQRPAHGGFTLVEVLGTMSILLVIGITAASMLRTVTVVGLNGKQNAQERADVARLAARFRADVHQAKQISLDDANQAIELNISGGLVRYRCHFNPTVITRERAQPTAGKSFERFQLTTRCEPEFLVDGRLATLRLTPEDARIPWVIEATQR